MSAATDRPYPCLVCFRPKVRVLLAPGELRAQSLDGHFQERVVADPPSFPRWRGLAALPVARDALARTPSAPNSALWLVDRCAERQRQDCRGLSRPFRRARIPEGQDYRAKPLLHLYAYYATTPHGSSSELGQLSLAGTKR